jgi:hypothetical protein
VKTNEKDERTVSGDDADELQALLPNWRRWGGVEVFWQICKEKTFSQEEGFLMNF